MTQPTTDLLPYKRSRFQTRLPLQRRYTAGHFWLSEREPGLWRVGLTRFATRMLGDLVEHDFESKPGDAVQVGQVIGWVEGFKAVTDLYCVAAGQFVGGNSDLIDDLALIDSDPYHRGWLYEVRGQPDPASVDVHGYTGILDAAIDQIQGQTQ